MSFLDDVVDDIWGQITTIGLATDSAGTEITGGGYTALAPTYAASSGGATDLQSTLQFDGPVNGGPVTHLIFRNSGGVWVVRPLDTPASFNSDGRLDVASAPVTADFAA